MEWLSVVQLKQPAHWWGLQLQNSKDVVAQAQAVAGLAAQLGAGSSSSSGTVRSATKIDDYIISILADVMRDQRIFCRCVCGVGWGTYLGGGGGLCVCVCVWGGGGGGLIVCVKR